MATWPEGIWAAIPTPFREDQSLDQAGMAHNVRHFCDGLGLAGVFCNGLVGEGWALSLKERHAILEGLLEAAEGRLPIGIVTTQLSLEETLALSCRAAASGADHIVLMRPAALFSEAELADYVRLIADAVDCRVVLFDNAAQSGGFPASVITALAREQRIHAVKCTRDGDAILALRLACGEDVTICDPYETHALANLSAFDARVLYADPEPYLYQLPGHCLIQDYIAAHARGDRDILLTLHKRLEPLRRVYVRWIQMPLMAGRPMNAALKHWACRMGMATGPVRRPLHALSDRQRAALDCALDAAFEAVFGARPEVLREHWGHPAG